MKLHWSPRSPFVRKVMITAHELGLVDRINCVRTVAAATKPHAELMKDNPLSKIPTLVLDDGSVIYDSAVVIEYLDQLHDRRKLIPAALPGITTGILLALARVAGETAPLLFTAFGNMFWSPGWNQPTASLPDTIFKYAISPYEEWHQQAWAAGLVLLTLVLAINIGARFILRRRYF